jgi:hypothetical protein
MSTRCTLDQSEDHCLFVDCAEPYHVFLRLKGGTFVARPGTVTVAIPLDLWQRIRAVTIDPANCWDDEDEARPVLQID